MLTPEVARKYGKIFFLTMLSTAAILLCWDAVMQFVFGLKFTVSWSIWKASIDAPIIPALAGLVVGIFFAHLFWSGHADSEKEIELCRKALKAVQNFQNAYTAQRQDIPLQKLLAQRMFDAVKDADYATRDE